MAPPPDWHLAQLNIAVARAEVDDPVMAEFMNALDEVNALAERSPGYVWRLQDDAGNATAIRPYDDPNLLVNLTVWESPEALKAFAYHTVHGDFFKRRREWFHTEGRGVVLWWVPAGHLPPIDEAKARLEFLRAHGPSPYAFTFASVGEPVGVGRADLDDAVVAELIGELNAELAGMYPEPGANHFGLTAADVAPGHGAFLVARLGDRAMACGAIRRAGEATAEVKRMYVRPPARGSKLGAVVLAELEREAAALGVARIVLETGTRQHAALGLYERAGYRVVPCWGEYVASAATSVCLEKLLG